MSSSRLASLKPPCLACLFVVNAMLQACSCWVLCRAHRTADGSVSATLVLVGRGLWQSSLQILHSFTLFCSAALQGMCFCSDSVLWSSLLGKCPSSTW